MKEVRELTDEYFVTKQARELRELFEQRRKESPKWKWLSNFFPHLDLDFVGGSIPFQAWGSGLIQDYPFYYRERGGIATLKIGFKNEKEMMRSLDSLYSASTEVEEFRRHSEWVETLFNLFENLEKSKFLYEFPCKEIGFSDSNDHKTAFTKFDKDDSEYGWGHSVKEAFENTKEISSYLESKGWTVEDQLKIWKLKRIDPFPKSRDNRIFPDEVPDFRLNVPADWRNDSGDIKFKDNIIVTSSGILEK